MSRVAQLSRPLISRPDPAHPGARDAFLIALARALHRYGTPSDRLEESVILVARGWGEPVQVTSTPTGVQLALGDPLHQRHYLLRGDAGEVHLGRLTRLSELVDRVLTGKLSAADGLRKLDRLENLPAETPLGFTPLAFALVSTCAARTLGAGLLEMGASAAIGLLIGAMGLFASRREAMLRIFGPVAATVAAWLASELHATNLRPELVTLSALIVLVPGFTLTLALRELSMHHLVSGTARLAAAAMSFLGLAFGIALGRGLADRTGLDLGRFAPPELGQLVMPEWSVWLSVLLVPIGFSVLFQVRWREVLWTVFAGLIGFSGARLGAELLGPELGTCLGALAVGAYSNTLTRIRRLPASLTQVPGILLLVPGSMGLKSLSSFLDHDVLFGVETAFQVMLVAVALVAGLLLANLVVKPRLAL